MTVRLLVGTPTSNGIVASDHAVALLAMARRLDAAGLDWQHRTLDGPNDGIGRDWLARHCLSGDRTHLLLLDRDMVFRPDLAERLLSRGRSVVGAVAARGGPDLDRLSRDLRERSFPDALALSFAWDVEPLGPDIAVEDGLWRVGAIGTGALMVERGCLEALRGSGQVLTYALNGPDDRLQAFFRDLHEAGSPWHGDYAFSRRWRAGGGEVYADVTADVRRIAPVPFGLPFAAFLEAMQAVGPDALASARAG